MMNVNLKRLKMYCEKLIERLFSQIEKLTIRKLHNKPLQWEFVFPLSLSSSGIAV